MPGVVSSSVDAAVVLGTNALDQLIAGLKARGYRVIGPRLGDGAIVYDDMDGCADLPTGVGDTREGGHYRLRRRDDDALFGYTTAAQGWKRYLYPPRQRLFAATRQGDGFSIDAPPPEPAPMAFIGVRACELAAIAIQARVFGDKDFTDPGYQSRLANAFVVAVQCGEAGDNCFCASMGTGPEVTGGYDIRLIEVSPGRFLADAAGARGAEMLAAVETAPASAAEGKAAAKSLRTARDGMGRVMDRDAAQALDGQAEHARWDDVASRCLTCGNCTMVCPTCFCSSVEDVTDLTGDHTERWRTWDSCFTIDFSYVHGGALRTSGRARYRQWITHKLSNWTKQFGTSGCVGCGRCITWCPVGIDITAEVAAIGGKKGEESHGADRES